jgi:hypothetical protein
MRKLSGIVLLLAIALSTVQLYSSVEGRCYASIDCEGGWWDPTAQCDGVGQYPQALKCETYVTGGEQHYYIHARCTNDPGDDDDCDV